MTLRLSTTRRTSSRTRAPRSTLQAFGRTGLAGLAAVAVLAGPAISDAVLPAPRHAPFTDAEVEAASVRQLSLEDCIGIALSRNLDLKVSRADLEKSRRAHSGSWGTLLPTLSVDQIREETTERRSDSTFSSGEEVFEHRTTVGRLAQTLPTGAVVDLSRDLRRESTADLFEAPTRTSNRAFVARVTQPLLGGAWPVSALRPIVESRYDKNVRGHEHEYVTRQTVLATRVAYYEALRDREITRVAVEAVKADSLLVAASTAMLDAKLASRRDVLSAEIGLAENRAGLVSAQKDYELALDRLKLVLGLPLETPIALTDQPLEHTPVTLDDAQVLAAAQTRHPLILGAEIGAEKSRYQARLARNAALPRVDLIGEYSKIADSDLDQIRDVRTQNWAVGFAVSYPLFHRETGSVADLAQLDYDQQRDRLTAVRRQIELEARDALRSLRSIGEEITALRGAITAAESKVDFANTMFNLGRASNLDITDAREALVESKTQYMRRVADYLTQLGAIESLTGLPLADPVR